MTSIVVQTEPRTVSGDEEVGLTVTQAPSETVVAGDDLPETTTRTVEAGSETETVTETTETTVLTGGTTVQVRKLAGTQTYEEPLFR